MVFVPSSFVANRSGSRTRTHGFGVQQLANHSGFVLPDSSYMVKVSPILGSIADARDTFQEAQLNRSGAIAGLATHLNPEIVKSAIAETDALEDLITSFTEANAAIGKISPPSMCSNAHRKVIDALDKEREGWEQLVVWYDSSGDDSLQIKAFQTLGRAGELIDQSAEMLLDCSR